MTTDTTINPLTADLATLRMDAVRALDDDGLRVVIARLLGYAVTEVKVLSRFGGSSIGYDLLDPSGKVVNEDFSPAESVEQAWWIINWHEWDRFRDWPHDLNAAVTLFEGNPNTLHLRGRGNVWDASLSETTIIQFARTSARAICLAWVAWKLQADV